MSEQKFEIIAGTDDKPPQILNEHLASDVDENGDSPSAKAVVDEWYAVHEIKLAEEKQAQEEAIKK